MTGLAKRGEPQLKYIAQGTAMPTLDITLEAGEAVFTEKGGMVWRSGTISMEPARAGACSAALGGDWPIVVGYSVVRQTAATSDVGRERSDG
jgi:hypothetical protein